MSKSFPVISKSFPVLTTNKKVIEDDDDSVETSSFDKSEDLGEEISTDEDDVNPLGEGDVHEEESDEDTDDDSEADHDSDDTLFGGALGEIKVVPFKPTVKPVILKKSDNYVPNISPLSSVITREEINTLLTKNQNINASLDDILRIETGETAEDFRLRKELTIKLANINNFKLNNMTAMVAASMLTKKTKLNVSYDQNIENALTYLLSLLQ